MSLTTRHPRRRTAGALTALVLAGGSAGTLVAVAGPAAAADPSPAATPAASLLADTTSAFARRAYLQGLVVAAASRTGTSSALTRAAQTTLLGVERRIAVAVAGSKSAGYLKALSSLDAAELTLVLDTAAKRSSAVRTADKARVRLGDAAVAAAAGQALGLTARQVADVAKLHAALSDQGAAEGVAVATKQVGQYAGALRLSTHSAVPAAVYAAAIGKKAGYPSGDFTTKPAALREALTLLFVQHVFQTGLLSDAVLTYGPTSALARAAGTAEDTNSRDIATGVQQLFGSAQAARFLSDFRAHIGGYKTYTASKLTSGTTATRLRAAALKGLNSYIERATRQFTALLTPLGSARIKADFTMHIQGTEQAIDAQAKKSATQFALADTGAAHFTVVAADFARAITAVKGLR